jgi:hypothetical protein
MANDDTLDGTFRRKVRTLEEISLQLRKVQIADVSTLTPASATLPASTTGQPTPAALVTNLALAHL